MASIHTIYGATWTTKMVYTIGETLIFLGPVHEVHLLLIPTKSLFSIIANSFRSVICNIEFYIDDYVNST